MRLRQLILTLLLAPGVIPAQTMQNVAVVPDCQIFLSATAIANSVSYDNRSRGCDRWIVTYSTYTFTAPSLLVQSSADNAGAPAAWVAFAGTIVAGVNPNVATTQALTSLSGFYPWMRLSLTAVGVGAGRLTATLYGYKDRPSSTVVAGLVSMNLSQYGGVAVGAGNGLHMQPSTGALWQIGAVQGGADGVPNAAQVLPIAANGGLAVWNYYYDTAATAWDRARGNAAGGAWVQGPAAAGAAPAGNPLLSGGLGSGATGGLVANRTICDLNAPITVTAAGSTEIVALTAARSIRVCHVSLSMQAPADIKLVRGTGVNCAAGPADITGVYSTAMVLSLDFVNGPVIVTAANALCINLGQAITGGGLITYALF